MQRVTFSHLASVNRISGHARSTTYKLIGEGLFPPPVKLGKRSLWADHEVFAVNAARLRGDSDDKIRRLVRDLVAARKTAGSEAA